MLDLIQISKYLPDMNVTVKVSDLLEMAQFCVQDTIKQFADTNTETYLSAAKVAKMLDISESTISRWGKRNYLLPIKVGGKRRYRRSDVERLLGERGCEK